MINGCATNILNITLCVTKSKLVFVFQKTSWTHHNDESYRRPGVCSFSFSLHGQHPPPRTMKSKGEGWLQKLTQLICTPLRQLPKSSGRRRLYKTSGNRGSRRGTRTMTEPIFVRHPATAPGIRSYCFDTVWAVICSTRRPAGRHSTIEADRRRKTARNHI